MKITNPVKSAKRPGAENEAVHGWFVEAKEIIGKEVEARVRKRAPTVGDNRAKSAKRPGAENEAVHGWFVEAKEIIGKEVEARADRDMLGNERQPWVT